MDSIFIISCCYFQHSISRRKEFNSISVVNIWNVMHATLLSSVVAPGTPGKKKKTNKQKKNKSKQNKKQKSKKNIQLESV